jgi:hypothetical protein
VRGARAWLCETLTSRRLLLLLLHCVWEASVKREPPEVRQHLPRVVWCGVVWVWRCADQLRSGAAAQLMDASAQFATLALTMLMTSPSDTMSHSCTNRPHQQAAGAGRVRDEVRS